LTPQQRREPPRDDEEAAAFKGLARAVTLMREWKGMDRDEFAAKAEITPTELADVLPGLNTKDRRRSLTIKDLLADLVAEDPETYREFTPANIAYHAGEHRLSRRLLAGRGASPQLAAPLMPVHKLPPATLDTFGELELDDLDYRIAHVLRMRAGMMGEPSTLDAVGEERGVGKERIRQLQNEGLMLIRNIREVQRHIRLRPTSLHGRGYVWNRIRR
jgi:hypothetical protein